MLSCIQAKLDSIKAKLTSERHRQDENIDKLSTRQSIDERNNNSDYEEPCKRPKIDLGSCSPIHSVNHFANNIMSAVLFFVFFLFLLKKKQHSSVFVTITKEKTIIFRLNNLGISPILLNFDWFYGRNNEPHWKMTWYEEPGYLNRFWYPPLSHSLYTELNEKKKEANTSRSVKIFANRYRPTK